MVVQRDVKSGAEADQLLIHCDPAYRSAGPSQERDNKPWTKELVVFSRRDQTQKTAASVSAKFMYASHGRPSSGGRIVPAALKETPSIFQNSVCQITQ